MNDGNFSSDRVWRRHWLPWVSIAVCIFIIGGIVYLFWYTQQPWPTPFRAQLQTTSLVFTVGDWQDSAGIFSSDENRVDLDFQGPCKLQLANQTASQLNSCPSMMNVRLQAMALPEGVQVYLDTDSRKDSDNQREGVPLRYVVQAASGKIQPKLTIAVFANSDLRGVNNIVLPKSKNDGEELTIYPGEGGDLEFRVHFRKAPADEEQIPVNGVSFNLRNRSAITGAGNFIFLPDAPHNTDNGLYLHGLNKTTIERLGLDLNSGTLNVTIAGEATSILLPDGSSQTDLVPNRLSKWSSNNSAGVVITAIGVLGTALVALFYAIKEFAWIEKHRSTRRRSIPKPSSRAELKGQANPHTRANTNASDSNTSPDDHASASERADSRSELD